MVLIQLKEIQCKSALSSCAFSVGSFCINPYVGCGHNCQYCYARYIKKFTGHNEKWGSFIDVRINIVEVLSKQLQLKKDNQKPLFIGTVTDPYQPIEKKYMLMRRILKVLETYENQITIMTKSDLILRDIDLLKTIKNIKTNITINTFNEKWQKLIEPLATPIKNRLEAIKKLRSANIKVCVMIGPYWPFFTDIEAMFRKFKELGVNELTTESFNSIGGNWDGVEKILKKYYPMVLPKMKEIIFNQKKFDEFYNRVGDKLRALSKKYNLPITIYF